jgi:hypothetical protein
MQWEFKHILRQMQISVVPLADNSKPAIQFLRQNPAHPHQFLSHLPLRQSIIFHFPNIQQFNLKTIIEPHIVY